MQVLSLFEDNVRLVLTDISDGTMKIVPEMSPEASREAMDNRLRAVAALGLNGSATALVRVIYPQQDYCKFVELYSAEQHSITQETPVQPSDGLLTTSSHIGLFLPLADCLGVVLYDKHQHALMLVHCGRHTLLQKGAGKALEFMQKQLKSQAQSIQAWFSPCAGKEKYPLHAADDKSLQEYAAEQLIQAGMPASSIQLSSVDTTISSNYFSHSQGDTLNRFAVCVRLQKSR